MKKHLYSLCRRKDLYQSRLLPTLNGGPDLTMISTCPSVLLAAGTPAVDRRSLHTREEPAHQQRKPDPVSALLTLPLSPGTTGPAKKKVSPFRLRKKPAVHGRGREGGKRPGAAPIDGVPNRAICWISHQHESGRLKWLSPLSDKDGAMACLQDAEAGQRVLWLQCWHIV